MNARDAARRWATAWAQGWPAKDVDRIVGLQAVDGDHWASMFRPYRGRAGLREYVQERFDAGPLPAARRPVRLTPRARPPVSGAV